METLLAVKVDEPHVLGNGFEYTLKRGYKNRLSSRFTTFNKMPTSVQLARLDVRSKMCGDDHRRPEDVRDWQRDRQKRLFNRTTKELKIVLK